MVYDKSQYFGSHLENCPPNDARTASGIVYRLVKNNPPNKRDFIPIAERCPDKINSESGKPNRETCQAHGLSVYKNKNEALINKDRFHYFRDAKLAIANLSPECGHIKKTSTDETPSHHTLWLPCEMKIWQVFEIEEQVGEQ